MAQPPPDDPLAFQFLDDSPHHHSHSLNLNPHTTQNAPRLEPSPISELIVVTADTDRVQQQPNGEPVMNMSNSILNEQCYDSYLYDFNQISPDLSDIDNLMGCDITPLDNYVHQSSSPTTSTTSSSSSSTFTTNDLEPIDEFFPQLVHTNKVPRKSSTSSSSASFDLQSDYRIKRDKNNISSQKSRAKREAKVRECRAEKERLERRNGDLRAMVNSLEEQVEDYKKMVMMFIKPRD